MEKLNGGTDLEEQWEQARLIPVVGTGAGSEREQRATSALLAVLSIVRPFSNAMLGPLGASKAAAARVDAYIEPPFKTALKTGVRPDGLIRVTYGSQTPFTALVEVKTGNNDLVADQLNAYIDIARTEKFDHVITISNEISPSEGIHPTAGLKVTKASRVKVTHFSWTRIAALAVRVRESIGVGDKEQEWVLGELLRYLEHASSGALDFDDMGEHWVAVRESVRNGSVKRSDPGVADIARRWDQLLTYAAMKLEIQLNETVEAVIPRAQKDDAASRQKAFVKELSETGALSGSLRVPGAIAELDIVADLRTRQVSVSSTFRAPGDKKARGSMGWLLRQLDDAPGRLLIESFPKGAAHGVAAEISKLREDATDVLSEMPGDIAKFKLHLIKDLGVNRRNGKSGGFVESVLAAISDYYGSVLQHLVPYQAKAPQVASPSTGPDDPALGSVK
ncbi:hypothetical protein [Demequina sp.]|uniref:hypothetical protein n=1 Tax=Demequina sp. TaxID=2050685 RepID=UPI0025B88F37|nr:hypothetical protein [Demequina sp.]